MRRIVGGDMGLRIDQETRARLDELAARTGRSRGAVIRLLIRSAELSVVQDIVLRQEVGVEQHAAN